MGLEMSFLRSRDVILWVYSLQMPCCGSTDVILWVYRCHFGGIEISFCGSRVCDMSFCGSRDVILWV